MTGFMKRVNRRRVAKAIQRLRLQQNQSWVCSFYHRSILNVALTRDSSRKLREYAEKHSALGCCSRSYAAQMLVGGAWETIVTSFRAHYPLHQTRPIALYLKWKFKSRKIIDHNSTFWCYWQIGRCVFSSTGIDLTRLLWHQWNKSTKHHDAWCKVWQTSSTCSSNVSEHLCFKIKTGLEESQTRIEEEE